MVRVQRDRRFDHESIFVVPCDSQTHRARNRNLPVKKFLGPT
jgi:hypothetical protein